ncbi:hypothetical protein A3L12_04000 [Thermococcus sp. P6]|uniref:hypothetical protein n=1 Tax=Thermococcus sp. P6 TaxID=122420 RepID=UPI000B599FD1|nr:hypothetical protein [Thermococcus sp. P6]ASJ10519.1 hypothetical protein A3L12_04000 [Thermococcus sp. P6]
MKGNHKRIFLLSLLVLTFCGLFFLKIHSSPSKPTPDPIALAMDKVLLYDNNLNEIEPQITLWVSGDCPDCRVLRAEAIVRKGNTTYLAFFDLQNGNLNLTPADNARIEEYLAFFEKNGGEVLPCNSTVKSAMNGKTWNERGTCTVPAVVKI